MIPNMKLINHVAQKWGLQDCSAVVKRNKNANTKDVEIADNVAVDAVVTIDPKDVGDLDMMISLT